MEIVTLKTEEHLLDQLKTASQVIMSAQELRAQRVSYIFSVVRSKATRSQIEIELNKQEGEV